MKSEIAQKILDETPKGMSGLVKEYGDMKVELAQLRKRCEELEKILSDSRDFIPFIKINHEEQRHTPDCKYPYGKCKCHLEELLSAINRLLNQPTKP